MFDNSWRSSTRRCPLGRCPMDDGKFSSYRAERGRAVREGSLRVRRGDLRERYRTTRLPAPSARGSAEAPRVPPTAATRAAGRGLLHPELTAVQVLAVELRDRPVARSVTTAADSTWPAAANTSRSRSVDVENASPPMNSFCAMGRLLCCFHAVSSCTLQRNADAEVMA